MREQCFSGTPSGKSGRPIWFAVHPPSDVIEIAAMTRAIWMRCLLVLLDMLPRCSAHRLVD